MESFGREYIGALNKELEGGNYKGYTPYVDKLIEQSTTYKYSYCNGRKSIDGMPSVLCGIPMFIEPFVLTPQSVNNFTGLAGILSNEGYNTAFFHGAIRGSLGLRSIMGEKTMLPTRVLAAMPTSMGIGAFGTSLSCNTIARRWAR